MAALMSIVFWSLMEPDIVVADCIRQGFSCSILDHMVRYEVSTCSQTYQIADITTQRPIRTTLGLTRYHEVTSSLRRAMKCRCVDIPAADNS